MGPFALLAFTILAAYRVTRLVVTDDFPPVQHLRDRLVGADGRRLDGTRLAWLGKLVTCYWCTSFWVSGLVIAATDVFASVPLPLLAWWSVAGGTALLSFWEDTMDAQTYANLKRGQAYDRAARDRASVTELTRTG